MGKLLSNIHFVALATCLALSGVTYAGAAPRFFPASSSVHSDVVPVVDSRTVRRDEARHDGDGWKKRRFHRDSIRTERRHHDRLRADRHRDGDGRGAHRPRATTKFAYDAYGNLRIYDGKRWDGRDWDHRDGWRRGDDWDKRKYRSHPRIIRMNSFDVPNPPPALKDVLTAVPDSDWNAQ